MTLKWQPVVLVLEDGERLECQCGALAVFVSGKHPQGSEYNRLVNVDCWCQDCWVKAVEEQEEHEHEQE